ncbi:hypothetical protein [Persicitalea jodogahamensis]|uniref:Uncharacterized protein n=1 Tax=Persicitalea jodogahamensis TaxID=402147 RepID=A0A8J3D4W2_9BACT|nr:hypothetical protein [Persicitalea jodogahamensis]GHB60216.1 hypothetical protein GCM10007390_12420 [Persicitalea jodogahamensis]
MKVLLLSTVREFYRQRAGFFLVVIFILFGFLTGREHYAFAHFFLTDEWGMSALLVAWVAYTLLCAQFLAHQLTRPEYVILHSTFLWPPWKRMRRLMVMALGFILPLIFYGIYVLTIARQENILKRTWPIFPYWLLLSLVLVAVAEWRLRNPDIATATKIAFRLPFRRPANFIFWTLEWLLRERGFTLLLSKAGVFLFMIAALVYDSTGTYDLRLPAVGFTLAYLLNAGLSYELYRWENEIWLWGKSLPFGKTTRFGRILILHAILLLPEAFLAVSYGTRLEWYELAQLYALGVSTLLLYHAQLYRRQLLLEETLQTVAIGFIILTLVILYKIPVALLALILLSGAWLGWRRWYG